MPFKEPSLTFGIEEEYHLVDRRTRDLAHAPEGMLRDCEAALGSQVSPEFLRSQIEIGTAPVSTFKEARAELIRLRGMIAKAANRHGLAPIAAGSHPFALPHDTETTDKERYQDLARDLAGVIRGLAVCGMHVHAAIEDEDLRVDLMNQARYFLPHLLTLSTSSPFWRGGNTGLKSFRLSVLNRMPRTGLPGLFSGWDEYQRTVSVLVDAGIIEDATKIWWDLRPSARFPTLEMRITDVCPRIEDALSIAALYLCFLRMLLRQRRANLKWRTYPISLIEENRWRAQRYGVTGELLDLGKGKLVPVRDLVEEIIDMTAEDADALDCKAEIANLRNIVDAGTSADRQVTLYESRIAEGASEHDALLSVVDMLIDETIAGTPMTAEIAAERV